MYGTVERKGHAAEWQITKDRFGSIWPELIVLFVQFRIQWVKAFLQGLLISPAGPKGGLDGFKNIDHGRGAYC
jgi:hypothetical protein